MTAIPQPSSLGAVPERISKPLRDVAARQWKLCAATGALRTLMVALVVVLPAVLWIALAILIPRPLFAGLYRVLMPWRDQLPTVLETIAVTPGDVTLAETDGLEIRAKVNGAPASATSSERALLLTRD